MAIFQNTHAPILNSNAQVLLLPVNSAGILLDSVLMRTKTLYPDNYQRYHRACRDGNLKAGSCFMHKRMREQAGLGISSNVNQPSYIANLVISDHPYHPARSQWLKAAFIDLAQQLMPLIRYEGVRKAALLARALIPNPTSYSMDEAKESATNQSSLEWQNVILPLFVQHLQDLPKLCIELHLPKNIHSQDS